MPAKNLYHDDVVAALIVDGWTITHDPLGMVVGTRRLFVDLAAEQTALGAERNGERVAVEVQSFLRTSHLDDFYRAVGQFVVYRAVLRRQDPNRTLFLAVPQSVYNGILSEPLGTLTAVDAGMKMVVFHPKRRRIIQWTS